MNSFHYQNIKLSFEDNETQLSYKVDLKKYELRLIIPKVLLITLFPTTFREILILQQ